MASPRALYVEPRMPRRWDWMVVVLTIASLGVLVVDAAIEDKNHELFGPLLWFDTAICSVLIADFGLRMRKATDRWTFFKRNWIDLLGSIPMVGPLRTLRVFRLLRILRLTRIAVLGRRLLRYFDVSLPGATLVYLTVITVLIWLVAAGAFYLFEVDMNREVSNIEDALWWSMTTLTTVGYGDVFPVTRGGRVVAFTTMVLGVGVLGTLAATLATALIEAREKGKKGLKSFRMTKHLLVINWSDAARAAVGEFRLDSRYDRTNVIVIADLPETPITDGKIRFVRGSPARDETLSRASAEEASIAIIFARDATDPRSDHETALIVVSLKAKNPSMQISAELVDPDNREFLERAGCESIVDPHTIASSLLVRSAQDLGVSELVEELLTSRRGSELYRVEIPSHLVGKTYRDLCLALLERGYSVVGLSRPGEAGGRAENVLNPPLDLRLEPSFFVYLVAPEPPKI